jgi:hypothetical protein
VVEFTDDSLNVQTGTDSIADDAATTATDNLSSAVDLAPTILLAGWRSADSGSDIDKRLITAELSSESTVLFTRGNNGDDDVDVDVDVDVDKITYQTIEFTDGTAVQSGTANFTSGESSKSVTISSVDTSMAVALATIQAGDGQNKGNTEYSGDEVTGEGSFTTSFASSTSLTIQRSSSNSASTLNWQTIDFSESSGGGDVDHFEISHDGSGINCLDKVITFTAADASGNAVEDYAGTTTLDTGSGKFCLWRDRGLHPHSRPRILARL